MRLRALVLAAGVLAAGCLRASGTVSGSSGPAQPALGDTARTANRTVVFGDPFSPDRGAEALSAFRPEIAATESGGECAFRKTSAGSNATSTTAYFPNRVASKMIVSLTFDSAGHLVQYSEMRGPPAVINVPPGTPAPVRDSLLKAQRDANRTTHITLNYSIDQAIVRNYGGGKPGNAVLATVREVESLAVLGPVKDRLVRIRRLCGV